MLFDVFICHASEDKNDVARPLAEFLKEQNLAVWYDEFSMSVGDSLRRSIDHGLAKSRFGIVVLSHNFFEKGWAQRELDGLVARQMSGGERVILPVWHNITVQEVLEYSPPLADTLAVNSADGIDKIGNSLLDAIKPNSSPLILARDHLIARGIQPPLISDEWWLDLAQMAESYNSGMHHFTWTFPLPGAFERGKKRAQNLAWSAMQWEWSADAEVERINHITHPERVLEFIRKHPGLDEICHQHPEYLACYVPQITIPGLGGEFENTFDAKLGGLASAEKHGTYKTVDRMPPLCVKEYSLRHPKFGNFWPREIADFILSGRFGRYNPQSLSDFEYLVWLLSDESRWMPVRTRNFLVEGVSQRAFFNIDGASRLRIVGPFIEEIWRIHSARKNREFNYTKKVVQDLKEIIGWTLSDLASNTSAETVLERMIELGAVEAHVKYERWLKEQRDGV